MKTTDCVAVDLNKGERCMLLKDYYGDWGICLGVWEGYKRGVPGKPGQYLLLSQELRCVWSGSLWNWNSSSSHGIHAAAV